MTRTFAYARVSTTEQDPDNQIREIAAAGFGVEPHRMIAETVSGSQAIAQRKGFARLLDKMERGDVLVVTKLDRLGRDAIDVSTTVAKLETLGIRVHCLALGGVDLTSSAGKLTMGVINAVAQFERDLLIERTQSGLARAKAQAKPSGVHQPFQPISRRWSVKRSLTARQFPPSLAKWAPVGRRSCGRGIQSRHNQTGRISKMDIEISVTITAPDGTSHTDRIGAFSKGFDTAGDIGLSIEEGKALLLGIQQKVVAAQCEAFCIERARCTCCDRKLRSKGRRQIRYRTVFGDIAIDSPRFYHLHGHDDTVVTFSPLNELLPDHIAPELLWLETKWASLVSFGVTADLLKDVLPIDARFSPDTIRRHLGRVATRMEAELAEERYSFIETSPHQRAQLPNPEGPITVGIDGGYVRSRDAGQSHFEVTVGKSIPTDRPSRYLGLVQSHDDKPKRRLHDVLKDQGWQENQPVTFMTDGGDTVINMALRMAPASEHILDWFHITMRITVMQQYVKGLAHHNSTEAEAIARLLRQIKGFLWNGNLHDGQTVIEDLVMDLDEIETDYASIKALRKAAAEFETYIANNKDMIPNYAERRRYGERVSTGFVESTVNTVVGKRFGKRQQMRWSKQGAHLMLQTRTRTLDGTLRSKFEQWYPGMKSGENDKLVA